jgi:GTPase Era involved in 16S rRNA processing
MAIHVVNFFAIEIVMEQLLKICVNEFEYAHHVAINMFY